MLIIHERKGQNNGQRFEGDHWLNERHKVKHIVVHKMQERVKLKNKNYITRYMTEVRRYIKDFCGLKK